MAGFKEGDVVRHATDLKRLRGVIVGGPDKDNIVTVRWFGPHEPDDWEQSEPSFLLILRSPETRR